MNRSEIRKKWKQNQSGLDGSYLDKLQNNIKKSQQQMKEFEQKQYNKEIQQRNFLIGQVEITIIDDRFALGYKCSCQIFCLMLP